MNAKGLVKYGIGGFLLDCVLLIEVIVDMRTGKLTWNELLMLIILSLLLAVPMFVMIKKYMRRNKTN